MKSIHSPVSAETGALITLDIEKAAAGGRMLARLNGQVVLVGGAVPGERVVARIERAAKGVVYAEVVDVLSPSPDRRAADDLWCGGQLYAHIAYARQLDLKAEIVRDAFGRLGKIRLPSPPAMIASPERGYRMRARLHVARRRIGFYREGTHELCDPTSGGQLSTSAVAWIAASEDALRLGRLDGLEAVELAENIPGDQRACHLELRAGVDATPYAALCSGLTGLSAYAIDRGGVTTLAGVPAVSDLLRLEAGDSGTTLSLRRDVRAFFQGNRFLIEPLVRHVLALVHAGPVLDLYAGVGLFGLALAASGMDDVTCVEGDVAAGADLEENASFFRDRVRVERCSVESYLAERGERRAPAVTVIVDPPRTGLSKQALAGVIHRAPRRIIYVSCDVATLARDARGLIDAGYGLEGMTGIDLFPNTAHVETVAVFGN